MGADAVCEPPPVFEPRGSGSRDLTVNLSYA